MTTEKKKSIIVFGPQGSKKTTNIKVLQKYYGLSKVQDEWTGDVFFEYDTLHITSMEVPEIRSALSRMLIDDKKVSICEFLALPIHAQKGLKL